MRFKTLLLWCVTLPLLATGAILWHMGPGGRSTLQAVVCELLLAFTVAVVWVLWRHLVRPVANLRQAAALMRGQDFASRLRPAGQPELDELIALFNHMMEELGDQRQKVRDANDLLDIMLRSLPSGVVVTGPDGRIVHINPAALDFAGLDKGTDMRNASPESLPRHLARALDKARREGYSTLRPGGSRLLRCVSKTFFNMGLPHRFYLIDELGDEMMAAQRQSYKKVLRVISHEINNALGGVNATLSVMLDETDAEADPVLHTTLATQLKRNGDVVKFISSLASTARIPLPEKAPLALQPLLADILEEAALSFPEIDFRGLPEDTGQGVEILADAAQMRQVLANVVRNAAESLERRRGQVTVALDSAKRTLTVADNGTPLSAETSSQIFTPFFTTKPQGQGIGLMVVAEILDNHGFRYSLETGPDSWTRFTIRF